MWRWPEGSHHEAEDGARGSANPLASQIMMLLKNVFILIFIYLHLFLKDLSVRVYHECMGACRGRKRVSNPLELQGVPGVKSLSYLSNSTSYIFIFSQLSLPSPPFPFPSFPFPSLPLIYPFLPSSLPLSLPLSHSLPLSSPPSFSLCEWAGTCVYRCVRPASGSFPQELCTLYFETVSHWDSLLLDLND